MPNYTVAGQVPQMGLASPPMPQSPASTPDQSLGLTSPPANVASPEAQAPSPAPDYNQLRSDATTTYLANGGTQANVDQYFANNPNPNYSQLASDAAQWYTGGGTDQGGIGINDQQQTPSTLPQPTMQDVMGGRNQQVANYFGIAPPAAGQNYNFSGATTAAAPAPAAPAAPSPYPQSWIDTYNAQSPETQAAIRARYSGMTPEQIMADWNANVAPNYAAGTDPTAILGGAAPTPQGPAGPAGSISSAMQSARTAAPLPTDMQLARRKADEAAFGAGSGTIYDPWLNPTDHIVRGQPFIPQGYGLGANTLSGTQTVGGQSFNVPGQGGPMIQWDQPQGPQGGYTAQGQQQMAQPITAAGQTFPNFQAFLDFMRTSTPAEQGMKTQLEAGKNPAGGSLFDALAPYLTANATTPPAGATPFTNWNPVSLLQLLTQSGLLK